MTTRRGTRRTSKTPEPAKQLEGLVAPALPKVTLAEPTEPVTEISVPSVKLEASPVIEVQPVEASAKAPEVPSVITETPCGITRVDYLK